MLCEWGNGVADGSAVRCRVDGVPGLVDGRRRRSVVAVVQVREPPDFFVVSPTSGLSAAPPGSISSQAQPLMACRVSVKSVLWIVNKYPTERVVIGFFSPHNAGSLVLLPIPLRLHDSAV